MIGFDKIFTDVMGDHARRAKDKQAVIGIVTSVSGNTCTVERTGAPTLYKVRLQAIEDEVDNYVRVTPKVGSIAICGVIENMNAEAFIIQCSEIERIEVVCGNKVYKADDTGHLVQGGDDTLKEVLQLIIEAVNNIIVMDGRNPDRLKLQQSLSKLNNILM